MNKDIGYRILCLYPGKIYDQKTSQYVPDVANPMHWFGKWSSYGGYLGVYDTVDDAKNSARANGVKKGTYEVWRFHIGLPTSDIPRFPPEKVA